MHMLQGCWNCILFRGLRNSNIISSHIFLPSKAAFQFSLLSQYHNFFYLKILSSLQVYLLCYQDYFINSSTSLSKFTVRNSILFLIYNIEIIIQNSLLCKENSMIFWFPKGSHMWKINFLSSGIWKSLLLFITCSLLMLCILEKPTCYLFESCKRSHFHLLIGGGTALHCQTILILLMKLHSGCT